MSNLSQFFAGGEPAYWVSGTTYSQGRIVRSPADQQIYVRIVAGSGTTDPSADATNWRAEGMRAIKSIQRGVISIATGINGLATGTATISSVVTSKTELRFLGANSQNNGANSSAADIVLTNATTITGTARTSASVDTARFSWELTEFY